MEGKEQEGEMWVECGWNGLVYRSSASFCKSTTCNLGGMGGIANAPNLL